MKNKTFIALILTAVLLLTLTACSKTQSAAASNEPNSDVQQTEQQKNSESSHNADSLNGTQEEPWKTALAEDLFQKYGVIPEHYEELGDGIYQVYVEVGGEAVPFVTVDSATGDYHG